MTAAMLFFANPKDMENLADVVASAQAAAVRDMPQATPVVVSGSTDYEANFARCGSWDGWIQDVIARCDSMSRKPCYAAIVVPGSPGVHVGAATAKLLMLAFRVQRPVFFYAMRDDGLPGTFRPATRVLQESASFKDGWSVW
jgi:hypothetical protein